ncbi:MAG: hypothetical protein HC901_03365 [Bdellovibrionaceae bacterium]|nr:hypothetical protein [Pseudobdellovibrionaceae bacterium]
MPIERYEQAIPLGIDPATPVTVQVVDSAHVPFADPAGARRWLKSPAGQAAVMGTTVNRHTGVTLEMGAGDLAHVAGSTARSHAMARAAAVANWQRLLAEAAPSKPAKPRAADAAALAAVRDYYAPMEFDGDLFVVRFAVQEYKPNMVSPNAISVYRVRDAKAHLGRDLPGTRGMANAGTAPASTPFPSTTGPTIEIGELLAGIKGPDREWLQRSLADGTARRPDRV